VTNKRSHVAKGLADDCITQYEREEFLSWSLFPKLVTDTKKNDMSAVIATGCADMWPRSKNNGPRTLICCRAAEI
jgi:hypothetical protein